MRTLEGKVAIVTGGLGGIGAAVMRRLQTAGARAVAWDLPAAVAAGAPPAGPAGPAEAVDVTDPEAVRAAVERVVAAAGRLDILVNLAGITRDAFAEKLALSDWQDVLRINLTGTFLPCQAAIPHLRAAGGGRIINTASTSALGNRGQANYAASKAGIVGLTRTLALELARDGITVNAIAPGPIATPMFAAVPQKIVDKFRARIPAGRFGEPDEIAALIAFLAGPDAAYITGQTLFCDGGLSLGG